MISNRFCTLVFFILGFWTSMVAGRTLGKWLWQAKNPKLSWDQIKKDLQIVADPTNPCKSLPARPNLDELFEANRYCKNAHEGYLQHYLPSKRGLFKNRCRGSNYKYFPSPACNPRNEQARSDFRCTVSKGSGFRLLTCRRPWYIEVDLEKCVEGWNELGRDKIPAEEVPVSIIHESQ
nr:PREDICTED: uncharacterized protein LOC109033684 [Bemisia tabaci]